MALDFVKIRSLVFSLQTLSSISLIDMTFKTLSKRQNGTVDLSLFSLHLIEGRVIPEWKKFISSGENTIRFLGDYIAKHIRQNSSLQEGQSLYLAGLLSNPETVKMLNQNGMLDCSCLASTKEEADIRIILHALYSDKLYQENNVQGRIVVKSPDTDVLVLLVHYFPNMKKTSELWFQTGLITSTKDCRRYIPVHELCKSLSSVV